MVILVCHVLVEGLAYDVRTVHFAGHHLLGVVDNDFQFQKSVVVEVVLDELDPLFDFILELQYYSIDLFGELLIKLNLNCINLALSYYQGLGNRRN